MIKISATLLIIGCFTLFNLTFAQAQILDSANIKISPTSINTTGDEIAPILHNGELLFLSEKNSDFSEHLNIFTLKKASIGEDGKPYNSNLVDKIFDKPSSGGPIAISADGNKAIFSKEVQIKHTKSEDKFKFFLFSTQKDSNGIWSEPIQLPFDDEHFSNSHPTLNKDFTKMYFVSDNQEGKGSADIWYTEFKQEKWTTPIDLGEEINTDGKEVFPYLYDENTLFFASDHHIDAQGLDIYMAKVDGEKIISINHLPAPINGPNNDFSLIFSEDKKGGFFCSNRNENNDDDIFQFKLKQSTKTNSQKINTTTPTPPLSQKKYQELYKQFIIDREESKCMTLDISNGLDNVNTNLTYRWKFSDGETKDGTSVSKCFTKRDQFTATLYTVDKLTTYEFFETSYPLNLINNSIKVGIEDSSWVGEQLEINYPENDIVDAIWTIDGVPYHDKQPKITFQKSGEITITGLISSKGSPLNFTEFTKKITIKESILKDVNFINSFKKQAEKSHDFFLNETINLKITNSESSTQTVFSPISSINTKQTDFEKNSMYELSVWNGNQYSPKTIINTENNPQKAINSGLKELSLLEMNVITPIQFKLNSSTETEQNNAIETLIKQLKEIPNCTLEIGTHTHSEGDFTQNSKLSKERSEFIKQQLLKDIPTLSISIANPTDNISLKNTLPVLNQRADIKIISL